MKRRVQNDAVGNESKKGVIMSAATTTYCQLGPACTKARSVGKMFKNIKCVHVCMCGTIDVILPV